MSADLKLQQIREASPGPRDIAPEVAAVTRRILCVFPRYTSSFGTFDHAYPLLGVKAFMPPQGLLTIAAYLPKHWEVRFVDENVRLAKTSEPIRALGIHGSQLEIDPPY